MLFENFFKVFFSLLESLWMLICILSKETALFLTLSVFYICLQMWKQILPFGTNITQQLCFTKLLLIRYCLSSFSCQKYHLSIHFIIKLKDLSTSETWVQNCQVDLKMQGRTFLVQLSLVLKPSFPLAGSILALHRRSWSMQSTLK